MFNRGVVLTLECVSIHLVKGIPYILLLLSLVML